MHRTLMKIGDDTHNRQWPVVPVEPYPHGLPGIAEPQKPRIGLIDDKLIDRITLGDISTREQMKMEKPEIISIHIQILQIRPDLVFPIVIFRIIGTGTTRD